MIAIFKVYIYHSCRRIVSGLGIMLEKLDREVNGKLGVRTSDFYDRYVNSRIWLLLFTRAEFFYEIFNVVTCKLSPL